MVWPRPSPLGDPPIFVDGKSCHDNSPNDTRQHWWTSTGLATYGAYLKFCCDFLFGHRKNHHLFFRTAADPQNEIRTAIREANTGRNRFVSTLLYTVGFRLPTDPGTPTASQVWQELYQEFGLWHNDVLNVHNLQHRAGGKRHNWMGCLGCWWTLWCFHWMNSWWLELILYSIPWFKIKLQRSSGIFFHDVPSQAIINQVCPKVLSTNLTFCSFQSPPFISTLNPCLGKGHIGPYTIIQWLHG